MDTLERKNCIYDIIGELKQGIIVLFSDLYTRTRSSTKFNNNILRDFQMNIRVMATWNKSMQT